jgi:phosphohistidine phosphatase
MRLDLVQHGEAKPEAEDPKRSLTVRGEEEVKKVSLRADNLSVSPAKVLHSGKLRAKQTAEIMAKGLKSPPRNVEAVQGLNPNDDVKPWAEKIRNEKEDMMIVGHLPFLEKLASYLLSGNENLRLVLFRYGAVVCLEQKEDKGWAIRWILTPEMSR